MLPAREVLNNTILVTYNHNGCETECATTLCHFGNAVDSHETVFQFQIICGLNSVIFIDDLAGATLCAASSKGLEGGTKTEVAAKVGD